MENPAKQRDYSELLPYQYKKGQSGNPSGRPKGLSLKEYVKMKFSSMTDDEREEFLNGLSKETIWKMGEANPENKTDVTSAGKALPIPILNVFTDNVHEQDKSSQEEN